MKKFIFSFLICLLSIFPSAYCSLELILLHNNDILGMLDQTTERYAYCLEEDKLKNKCVGGLPRIISVVKSFRKSEKNVMYLFAGNICHGSVWFSLSGPPIVYELMNVLKPDAVALGSHEFVNGEEKLTEYVSNLKTQILSSNLDLEDAPELKKYIKPWTIIQKDGYKIGVIGYTSVDTPKLSGKLPRISFKEVVTNVRLASAELAERGATIQIVMGDNGFDIDRDIAMLAPSVDVVIGANYVKFLYNGDRQPCIEKIDGGYPVVVKSLHNREVPLAYSYKYSKYIGCLNLTFDDDGKLIGWNGQPIHLNNRVPQDEIAVKILDKYRPKVETYQHSTLGTGKVLLEGEKACRIRECNFGNLLADSLVHHAVKHLTPENSSNWTSASISFVSGSAISGHLNFLQSRQNITVYNISSAIPFKSKLVTFRVRGDRIVKALATAIGFQHTDKPSLFQVSGLKVVYNRKSEKKVVSVKVRCADCSVPDYKDIQVEAMYSIISTMQVFERSTASRFFVLGHDKKMRLDTEADALMEYVRDIGMVFPEIEDRITFIEVSGIAVPIKQSCLLLYFFVTVLATSIV